MSNYLKLFNNHSEYTAFTQTDEFVKPNVSHCIQENEVHYNPYITGYLAFVAKADGTFKFSGSTTANTLSYSLDNGSSWVSLADNTDTPTITSGSKILWKGNCTPQANTGIGTFISTANFDVKGNAMSLLFEDDFIGQTSLEGKDYALKGLFSGNTNISNAENLLLPATTLANNCYNGMFYECTSLTAAPQLPATTLADECYESMFKGCTSLTTAPELLVTTLAYACYYSMFWGCTSMTTAPQLPATTLTSSCYGSMFRNCTSLTTAPQLPATTLTEDCYNSMFYGCTSMTTAPQLPATTLATRCYFAMFYECTNLNYIKAMFTTTPSNTYTQWWVNGVASTGTFVKNSAAAWNVSGINGIPNGWTVQTASE